MIPSPQIGRTCLVVLSSILALVEATPYPRDRLHDAGFGYLLARSGPDACPLPCGPNAEHCCESGQTCTTLSDPSPSAACVWAEENVLAARQVVYTTTWTETHVFTSTVSNADVLYTTEIAVAQCVPPDGSGQIGCGAVCCGSWQTCAWEGQCLDRSSGIGGPSSVPVATTTVNGVVTTRFSPPVKATSIPTSTITATAATGTAIGGVDGGDDGDDGLSGGAIAGIVIGVIAGVMLLILLCACCCIKGALSGFMRLIGAKSDDDSSVSSGKEVHEEGHYRRYGTSAAGAHRREKSGGKGMMAGLGAMAVLLGLKRHHDDKKNRPARSRSSYTGSSYLTDYSASSPSSASTRRTRQTRGSRGTRGTRYTRSSRRSSRR